MDGFSWALLGTVRHKYDFKHQKYLTVETAVIAKLFSKENRPFAILFNFLDSYTGTII